MAPHGGRRREVAYLPKLLAHFRWLHDNKTATGNHKRLDEICRILARAQNYPPPAYIELERANLYGKEGLDALRRGRLGTFFRSAGMVTGTMLRSPRAIGSLFSPFTWRIIYVGQVLRRVRPRRGAADAPRRTPASAR